MQPLTFDQEWSTSICSWFGGPNNDDGCKTCFLTYLLPCVQYGLISQKLEPGEAPCSGSFGGACCLYVLMLYCGCPCLVAMGTRTAVRRKYNLKDEPCGDFCTTWCCGACSLCQEHYQLTSRLNAAPYSKAANY